MKNYHHIRIWSLTGDCASIPPLDSIIRWAEADGAVREANDTWRGFLFDDAVALAGALQDPELIAIARRLGGDPGGPQDPAEG